MEAGGECLEGSATAGGGGLFWWEVAGYGCEEWEGQEGQEEEGEMHRIAGGG